MNTTSNAVGHDTPETIPAGWDELPPEHLPTPTFWPAGLALAIAFVFWGLITSWVVLVVGIAVFAVSLAGWITNIRHERNEPHA